MRAKSCLQEFRTRNEPVDPGKDCLRHVTLRFYRQLHIRRALFLGERATKFRERDVLQLPNALPRDAEFFTHFLESLGFSAVQTEALEDDLLLAIVEHLKQTADFVAQVLVAQQLERRLGFLVADDLAKLRRIIVANRRIERSRTNRDRLELGNFPARDAHLVAQLVVGW